ncbi:hypothetical protein SKAU_G00052080 [Synaphobranchus kaupii]|uniref:Uncharacterized protein n=1 Tax=Synaphobranchus kaupii TaxID=118154 RepID=A0A9Q1J9J3_SYNKA|nr:hypothetical protein SKAU_G00052080 [Synaphobranchus kaupii]
MQAYARTGGAMPGAQLDRSWGISAVKARESHLRRAPQQAERGEEGSDRRGERLTKAPLFPPDDGMKRGYVSAERGSDR